MSFRRREYLSPKCELRLRCESEQAVYAAQEIKKGELIAVWSGELFRSEDLSVVPPTVRRYTLQIEDDLYLVSVGGAHGSDLINHSCDPNAGLNGATSLVAMRDIKAGEEICYDYAMSDGSPYDEFTCQCGSPLCRGAVTGSDWSLPQLQVRYLGFFSPYLMRRMNRMTNVVDFLAKPERKPGARKAGAQTRTFAG